MDAVLGDTQLSGNVMFRYSSVCYDDVMNHGDGLCGGSEWSSRLSLPRLNSAAHLFTMLYEGASFPNVITKDLLGC